MTHRNTLRLRAYNASAPHTPASFDRGPAWMVDPARACAPEHGNAALFTSDDAEELHQATTLCRQRCPFRAECGEWAAETKQAYGVWGGKARTRGGKARTPGGLPVTPELVRTTSPRRIKDLTEDDQAAIIREGLSNGLKLGQLAQHHHLPVAQVYALSHPTRPSFDDRLRQLHAEGLTSTETGVRLGVDGKTVRQCLDDLGLPRNPGRSSRQRTESGFDEQLKRLHAEGLPTRDISVRLEVNQKTVRRHLDQLGLTCNPGRRGRPPKQLVAA